MSRRIKHMLMRLRGYGYFNDGQCMVDCWAKNNRSFK